ncbi:MAG: D-alanine--D-alanine ligase [Saprospiraceae bacterium]|nr:D-alanine--D-alanine ligase [Saprospiraceae bacterium]
MNIALITGGDGAEREISLLSAKTVEEHLDRKKYKVTALDYAGRKFRTATTGEIVDWTDFSLHGEPFDLAFLMLHGHPGEDGIIQGYLDLMGVPYTGCDSFVSGLTFDKQACKNFLRTFEIPMAPSVLVFRGDRQILKKAKQIPLPVFVKPNKNGSSYGISKVNKGADLKKAIDKAFEFDDEVLIEGFLDGEEYTCGAYRKGKEIVVLPITEIVPHTEFFDYEAKYKNQSEEITPARLSKKLKERCQALTKKLYQVLGCKGICRMDYILVGNTFFLLEANTIPGMSANSLIPQQAEVANISLMSLYDSVIKEALEGLR